MMDSEKYTIALAGNPNVGKSTIFNALTNMHQHTGNWPGKTVSNASGILKYKSKEYKIYDLPGIYSILAHSEEEFVARDFLCFESPNITVVVCDATCLMRNLNLVIQICEMIDNVIVCVNLLDEAQKKGIKIDLDKLSKILHVRVVGTSARSKKGLNDLLDNIDTLTTKREKSFQIVYTSPLEKAINTISSKLGKTKLNKRWIAINLIKNDEELKKRIILYENIDLSDKKIDNAIKKAKSILAENDILLDNLEEVIVTQINNNAESIFNEVVSLDYKDYDKKDRFFDKILTNKITGIPIMLLLFGVIFWITIQGSNYPSKFLQDLLFKFEDYLFIFLNKIHIPNILNDLLVHGIYRVLAWVVSVMLPPMAIFFPLFTILEDIGYLPRIAFNVDGTFQKCKTCGKQSLTMAMGMGCNAVGVTGCRIIDSPREKLIAILTNSFIPCNGRFPTLISLITMFIITSNGLMSSVNCTLLLIGIIVIGILMTFLVSKILSKTILKGESSSFTLELPPYRKPQVGKVIVRSIFDRTIFVLGRAISIAAPAGLIIWLFANIRVANNNILGILSEFLNPFGKLLGMDGVILLAFILGFPANEIVIPIIIMTYMAGSNLIDINNTNILKDLFINHGWTFQTAISVMIFSLMHWPCSTTCLTIKKETNSWKWTILAILIPTFCGIIICMTLNLLLKIFI